ncbi:unnamed protein product (macronuclear) [Paramecium tetraurelia]|uniref:Transmembrane protein n=1 Tax=Paramecium tetraurelia TaxID=5888 RepID=A0CY83_PARTE|nr:uncharacterized protein GSPATT00039088001 [Paramecium tetraurelia]CAK75750.1 unnamed protein product [Paramecium tetraurelia]|eukprot:XP_001443147.1 hypothetical protein (macronuclear) [Paramecium tetraurelia strain d4-2]
MPDFTINELFIISVQKSKLQILDQFRCNDKIQFLEPILSVLEITFFVCHPNLLSIDFECKKNIISWDYLNYELFHDQGHFSIRFHQYFNFFHQVLGHNISWFQQFHNIGQYQWIIQKNSVIYYSSIRFQQFTQHLIVEITFVLKYIISCFIKGCCYASSSIIDCFQVDLIFRLKYISLLFDLFISLLTLNLSYWQLKPTNQTNFKQLHSSRYPSLILILKNCYFF